MILFYCIQPIDCDTDFFSIKQIHRAYQYILKTKQLHAKVLKNGPFKQAVRLFHKLFHMKGLQNYQFC